MGGGALDSTEAFLGVPEGLGEARALTLDLIELLIQGGVVDPPPAVEGEDSLTLAVLGLESALGNGGVFPEALHLVLQVIQGLGHLLDDGAGVPEKAFDIGPDHLLQGGGNGPRRASAPPELISGIGLVGLPAAEVVAAGRIRIAAVADPPAEGAPHHPAKEVVLLAVPGAP